VSNGSLGFGRGFDDCVSSGLAIDRGSRDHALIDEHLIVPRRDRGSPSKKLIAGGMAAIMVFSALVVMGASLTLPAGSDDPLKAEIQEGTFEREVNMTVSNMFELYLKSDDYNDLGRSSGVMGVNDYMDYRTTYGEYMVRYSYPFVLGLGAYSTMVTPDTGENVGNLLNSWYKLAIDAGNLTSVGTGSGKDPIFVPVLGTETGLGGGVDIWYYATYLNTQELVDLRAGTHYGNTYYDVPDGSATPHANSQDGYYHELQGKLNISRDAVKKVLDLTVSEGADLNDAFLAERSTIEAAWWTDWETTEGSQTYDIYTAYDYPNDLLNLYITLDDEWEDEGTYGDGGYDPDTLSLRLYCISWGMEVLLVRYMEAAGLMQGFQCYADDWYLNISMDTNMGNITSRGVNGYHLTAWEDPSADVWSASWMMESQHIDWCGNTAGHEDYPSPYTPYDPTGRFVDGVTRMSRAPGTVNYGVESNFWIAPVEADLGVRENLTINLPDRMTPALGYTPYQSVDDDIGPDKVLEWNTNSYWGELVLGTGCWPSTGESAVRNFYDQEAKTIHMSGPVDFPVSVHPDDPLLMNHGTPLFIFNVQTAHEYDVTIDEGEPYLPGESYTLRVTVINGTEEVPTIYNSTVLLSCTDPGAILGEASHTFVPSDLGTWTTTVTFGSAGSWQVDAADINNTYIEEDIVGSMGVTAIPEFGTLLIPVIGVASMLFVFRAVRRRRKVPR